MYKSKEKDVLRRFTLSDRKIERIAPNHPGDSIQDGISLYFEDESILTFSHYKEDNEEVYLVDVGGDIWDLLGSELLSLTESFEEDVTLDDDNMPNFTRWTYYNINTTNGTIVLKWLGKGDGEHGLHVDTNFYDVDEVREINSSRVV